MVPRNLMMLAASLVLLTPANAASEKKASASAISEHTRILAADDLEGRQPGSPAEPRTLAYIIDAYRKAGLQPGAPGGGWTQSVPVTFNMVDGPVAASISVGGRTHVLTQSVDLTVLPRKAMPAVRIQRAPLYFIGYGVSRPDQGWDDLKGFDVRGKVVVVLAGTAKGGLAGGNLDAFDIWTSKQAEFAKRGALGIVLVQDPAEPWAVTRRIGSDPQITPDQSDPAVQWGPDLTGVLKREIAEQIFSGAGTSLANLEAQAARPDFKPMALGDAVLSIDYKVSSRTITSQNVIGMVRGRTHPDEAIIYSAHWDGLGRSNRPGRNRRPNAANDAGDDIYNGAVDNAVGVGTVLEIARRFREGPPPERSVYFIAFTWEEAAHLGAMVYINNPSVPIEKTVGVINFDVASLFGKTSDIAILGGGKNSLEQVVGEVAGAHGKTLRLPREDSNRFYRRSDHFEFARQGVPAVFMYGGMYPVDKSPEVAALVDFDSRYIAERYHTVDDEWTPTLNFVGVAELADIAHDAGQRLANSRIWPDWNGDSDFKALRDRSRALRQ